MMTRSYDDKLAEVKAIAVELGKRLEESLIGYRNPSADRVKEMYKLVKTAKFAGLSATFGDETTLERLAAEGVMVSIIDASHMKVVKWRIEHKAQSCACALMDAKRVDAEGIARRDKVYQENHAALWKFITEVIPEDPEFGYSFARPIMDEADAEVKAAQLTTVALTVPVMDKAKEKRNHARAMAEQLGKRLEDNLIGDPNPSEKRVKEVYDMIEGQYILIWVVHEGVADQLASRMETLHEIYGKKRTLEKIAAEGVFTAIIHNSHNNILRSRIEMKARSCASALLCAKRVDAEGIKQRGKVYDRAYGSYQSFIRKIMPEDPDLGMSYGKAIMENADKEVKDSWKATKTG